MGNKKLNKSIAGKGIEENINIEHISGRVILGVDALNLIYRETLRGKVTEFSHIIGLFNFCYYMMRDNIELVFVFDGSEPEIKAKKIIERRMIKMKIKELIADETDEERIRQMKKNSYRLTRTKIDQCKQLLTLLGIKYYIAETEADIMLASMFKKRQIGGVYSYDLDIMTFGCGFLFNSYNYRDKTIKMIRKDKILEALDITNNEFVWACVFAGNDYISASVCDFEEICRTIKESDGSDHQYRKVFDILKRHKLIFNEFEKYSEVYDYYTCSEDNIEGEFNIKPRLNITFLRPFLLKLGLDYDKIKTKIVGLRSFH